LFGLREYASSVAVLQMLSPGLFLVYIDFVLVTALVALDRQRQWSVVALLAIPLSIGLNYLLIPLYQGQFGNGGIGSAMATNITELFIMVAALVLMPKGVLGGHSVGVALKGGAAGLCMAGTVWLLQGTPVPWMLSGIAGFAVYSGAIWILGLPEDRERELLRGLVSVDGIKRVLSARRRTAP